MGLAYQIKVGAPLDRTCDVRPGEPITMGSADGSRLVLDGSDPLHCRIEVTVRGVEVFNASKSAGTFVNGRRVERSLLKEGDELRLGQLPPMKIGIKSTETSDAGFGPGAGAPPSTQSDRVTMIGGEAVTEPASMRQGMPGGPRGATQTFSKEALKAHAQAQSLAQAVAQAQAQQQQQAPASPTTQSFAKTGAPGTPPPGTKKDIPFFGVAPTGVAHTGPGAPPATGSGAPAGAQTLTPGAFNPKAPPPLTRKFDPTMIPQPSATMPPGPQVPPGAPPGSITQVFGVGGKPFRMSSAEETGTKQIYKERDGSALLGQQNASTPQELTRRSFFGAKAQAEEKAFEPAPAFEPESFEGSVTQYARGAPAPLDPSLRAESQEEKLVRSELEASGLAVLERLGGSANVTVYRARRRDLGQEVVVKAVKVEQGDPDGRAARLLAEAKVAAKLHHPGIVQVHGVFRGRSFVAIVLESLHGISLADEVAARGKLTAREAAALGERLCRSLSHAHGLGVVHRDVAPRNVMLTDQGLVKLLGFGFAASIDPQKGGILGPTEAPGTPGFVAPEQHANPGGVDRRADVYGLGATLFFALSGKSPEVALGMEGTAAIGRELTGPIARVIARALRANPGDRFESCDALQGGLRDAAAASAETGSLRKGVITDMLAQGGAAGAPLPAANEPLGFRGKLPGREVVGLLRGVEAGKKTGWLEVRGATGDGGEVVGAVYFRDGDFVRSAVSGRRTAAEALLEVALLPIADFAIVYAPLEALAEEERVGVTPTLQQVAERLTGRR